MTEQEFRQQTLGQLERALLQNPQDERRVEQFYRASERQNAFDRAEVVLKSLVDQAPHYRHIRQFYIACCLQQEKLNNAMDSIETLVTFSPHEPSLIESALAVRQRIGPKSITQLSGKQTLSLCMIVKNEIRFLAPCLNSIKSLVDEIVLVDTGSEDDTKRVGKIFGAHVHCIAWEHDFAKARNYGLRHAQGDWILVLDADETIAPEDHANIKYLLNLNPVAYTIETRNYTYEANAIDFRENTGEYPDHETGTGWISSRKIRLFPNRKGITFHYPVHELVEPSMMRSGMSIATCEVPIHHYGCLNPVLKKEKAEKYFALGYSKLNQFGNHPSAIKELATQAAQLGYWKESLTLWERYCKLIPEQSEAYVNIASAHWQLSKYEKALEASEQAIRLDPSMKEASYNKAVSLILLDDLKRSTELLDTLCRNHPGYVAAVFMLGLCYGCAGDAKRCSAVLSSLNKDLDTDAMRMGARDFAQRLKSNRQEKLAETLLQSLGVWRLSIST